MNRFAKTSNHLKRTIIDYKITFIYSVRQSKVSSLGEHVRNVLPPIVAEIERDFNACSINSM